MTALPPVRGPARAASCKIPGETSGRMCASGVVMAERFYVAGSLTGGAAVELGGAEAHHLAAVCRARPGDTVCLFNGDGREYTARVTSADRRRVVLEVVASAAPA